jgi:hypothetical protein
MFVNERHHQLYMLLLQALLFFLLSISVTAIPVRSSTTHEPEPVPLNRRDGVWTVQFNPELDRQFYIKVENGRFSKIYPEVRDKAEVDTLFTNGVWTRVTEVSLVVYHIFKT